MASKVQLYVYDVTKGLATQMSSMLLGHHIDGVWHTGIVCYDREYFFGSGGIDGITPGTTMLGAPNKIIDLGETFLTNDVFHEFLFSIGNDQFRPEKYHLFDHNCNTFSNELAQFLTGKNIPSYILDLPRSIASTPLGAMLRTFMEGITNSPGHQNQYHQSPFVGQPIAPQKTTASKRPVASLERKPVIYTYEEAKCLASLRECVNCAEKEVTSLEKHILEEGDSPVSETSMKIDHIIENLSNILGEVNECKKLNAMVSLLDIISIIYSRRKNTFLQDQKASAFLKRVLENLPNQEASSTDLTSAMKLATNLFSSMETRTELVNSTADSTIYIYEKLKSLCLQSLLGSHEDDTTEAGISFACNLFLSKIDEETEIELASALLHWLNENDNTSTAGKKCVTVLKSLMNTNEQVTELAEMITTPIKLQ